MNPITLTSTTLGCLLLLAAAFPQVVYSAQPASVIYDNLEVIQDNRTALRATKAPAWVNAPSMRGTSSILLTCIFTLFACTYKALHLNIPTGKENASFIRRFAGKTRWVFIALIAPEFTLWVAMDQYLKARELSQYLTNKVKSGSKGQPKKICDMPKSPKSNQKLPDYDLKYGFFVVMGGLELPSLNENDTRVLSHEGVMWLADRGQFLPITREHILDRSKADNIQKTLVLFQVGWMALQCVARKAYGLPLCLLEVHTLVHVGCGILTYFFWMEKPLDVRNPAEVDLTTELETRLIEQNSSIIGRTPIRLGIGGSLGVEARIGSSDDIEKGLDTVVSVSVPAGPDAIKPVVDPNIDPITPSDENENKKMGESPSTREYKDPLVYSRRTNLPKLRKPSDFGGVKADIIRNGVFFVSLLALPVVYGGIHLSAWNFDFPTDGEAITWRVASLTIAASIPGFALLLALFLLFSKLIYDPDSDIWVGIFLFFGAVLFICVILCRMFLVVESFVSLRSVPIGVYWSPSWIQMIPHL
ncbi:hypothetical protein QBC38DRAFT_377103 [Podospora fimiseda]|uniref:Uncharacterized protein n=1 Tax=Podospora fimiseda TaxID=252190 RepID=A0AAN6YMX0_9PEZI|nr:hypothetical protein QBC38DRAFT_377103 [Podospora fimiseda]